MRDIPTWVRTSFMMISMGSLFAVAVGVAGAQRGPQDETRPVVEEQLGPMNVQPRDRLRPMDQGMGQRMGMFPDQMGGDHPRRFAPGEGHMMQNVAGLLQMQPEQLRDQLASGRTLADIARSQGVDPDALADQIASAVIQEHQNHIRSMIRESMERSLGPRQATENR